MFYAISGTLISVYILSCKTTSIWHPLVSRAKGVPLLAPYGFARFYLSLSAAEQS